MASIHDKLERVRKPRVHITYQVETEGAQIERELPFVVGVMGDFSGDPTEPLKPLKERKFIQIDRDNFNDVMASLAPRLAFPVDNRLKDGEDGGKLNVELKFRRLDDLRPESLVQQIEPLRKLFEARQRLNDLLGKLDGNDDLDLLLQDIAANTDSQQQLKQATAPEGGTNNG